MLAKIKMDSKAAPKPKSIDYFDNMKRTYHRLLAKCIMDEYLKAKEAAVPNQIRLFVSLVVHLLKHKTKIICDWLSDEKTSFGEFINERLDDIDLHNLRMYNIDKHVDKFVDMIVSSSVEKEVFLKSENDEFIPMNLNNIFNLDPYKRNLNSLDALFYGSIDSMTPIANIVDVYVSTYNLVYPKLCGHKNRVPILTHLLRKGDVALRENGELINFEKTKANEYISNICAPVNTHKWCRIALETGNMFYTPARICQEHEIAIGTVETDLYDILKSRS